MMSPDYSYHRPHDSNILTIFARYRALFYLVPRVLRREGLSPALAPRMPVMQANRGHKCDSAAKGCIKNKSCLNEEKENTGIRFNERATNFAIRHPIANSSRKRQPCCRSNSTSVATQSSSGSGSNTLCAYKYIPGTV